jgi:uncharacterized membrane protein YebE (DUF533 family)
MHAYFSLSEYGGCAREWSENQKRAIGVVRLGDGGLKTKLIREKGARKEGSTYCHVGKYMHVGMACRCSQEQEQAAMADQVV